MAEVFYVGYQNQLRQAADELQSRVPFSSTSPAKSLVLNITGPAGVGKRTFVKRLWDEIEKGEIPRVIFTLDSTELENIAENFLTDAKANRTYLEAAIDEIAEDLQSQADHIEKAGKSLTGEARITVMSELVEQHLVDNTSVNKDLQIVFVLPEFVTLSPVWRDSFARQIPRGNDNVDCRIIVTSQSLESHDDVAKIFPDRMPIMDIQLPAMTTEDVEQWLVGKQLSLELAEDVYKRSGGIAGKLEHAALETIKEREEKLLAVMAENALGSLSDDEKSLLCLAAMLPEINERSLLVIMKEPEARIVMDRLRDLDWPESEWKDGRFAIGQKIRQALVKYLENHYPQLYRKALPQAEQFTKIYEVIPSAPHRENLAKLSAFNYFNESLLREVSPTTADELVLMTIENPGYFENTGSNFKIRNELRPIIETYIKMVGFVISNEDRTKIAAAWEARRKKIMDTMTSNESKIKKDSDALAALQAQIRQIGDGIDKEMNRINRQKRYAQRKDQSQSKNQNSDNKLQISRIAMILIGFIILYLSLLFYSKTSLIYAAVGFGLMVGALFVRSNILAAAKVQTPPSVQSTLNEAELLNRNLHFMNIKRSQLESKQKTIALSIAREKTTLKEFDKQLREPYS
jgi:hypothetical protein